ncbi:MAG: hypothetical protein R3212_10540, partial [Xanthomonadales bacterium]|nr:hypothetical protein [Xanthomonadales bacterium]
MHLLKLIFAFGLALAMAAPHLEARGPYVDPAEDTKYFGDPDDFLNWAPKQQVAGYRNIELISPARRIEASTQPA